MPKNLVRIDAAPARHWVGDGFHVHSMFSYHRDAALYSPFLMLDYGAPFRYAPNLGTPRGVGAHPHRGFETVTIAYSGEVAHRDSSGGGGTIGEGDVQWMTAGSGLVHDEFHSPAFSRQGGEMHMVQLWVNLPAKYKMTQPGYQAIGQGKIPKIDVNSATGLVVGSVRLIAGKHADTPGAAHTFTPMNVWDVCVHAGQSLSLPQPEGWITLILVQSGQVSVNSSATVGAVQLIVLSREGRQVDIHANQNSQVLLLAGLPINEPIVGYGPFVMNSEKEIHQAFADYHAGQFGGVT